MPDYSQECEVFFRELKDGLQPNVDERLFLVQWERLISPKALGIRRFAILGGEYHILKLINRWNRSADWKYTLLPNSYLENIL